MRLSKWLVASATLCLASFASAATADDDRPVEREREGDRPREREGERERERDVPRERDREREAPREGERERDGFRPQTDREAVLMRVIMELQQEVRRLRGEVEAMQRQRGPSPGDEPVERGPFDRPRESDRPREADRPVERGPFDPPRDGERDRPGPRDGDRPRESDRPRDGDAPRRDGPRDGERTQRPSRAAEILARYDRDKNGKISAAEFLRTREGTDNREVASKWERVFAEGDRNRDGQWSLEELAAVLQRSPRGEGDGQRKDGPRDGDRPRTDAPRERDQPRESDRPRDGDRPREGDRDGA